MRPADCSAVHRLLMVIRVWSMLGTQVRTGPRRVGFTQSTRRCTCRQIAMPRIVAPNSSESFIPTLIPSRIHRRPMSPRRPIRPGTTSLSRFGWASRCCARTGFSRARSSKNPFWCWSSRIQTSWVDICPSGRPQWWLGLNSPFAPLL